MHYTPAWYWQRFPGFLNVECYRILANWTEGVPDDEDERKILPTLSEEEEEEQTEEETRLKKRKVEDILSK